MTSASRSAVGVASSARRPQRFVCGQTTVRHEFTNRTRRGAPPAVGRWQKFVLSLLGRVPQAVYLRIIEPARTRAGRRSWRRLANGALWVMVALISACASDGDHLITGTVHSSPLLAVGECFDETPQSAFPGA
jgi:hypothetical protein